MATISFQCPECNARLTANVGESYIDGTLRWYQSWSCWACGNATELDDIGFPPDEVRAALINESGYWQLVVADATDKSKAIQIIRVTLGLSLLDSKKLVGKFPQVYAGTETECTWLKNVLDQSNVAAYLVGASVPSMDAAKEER